MSSGFWFLRIIEVFHISALLNGLELVNLIFPLLMIWFYTLYLIHFQSITFLGFDFLNKKGVDAWMAQWSENEVLIILTLVCLGLETRIWSMVLCGYSDFFFFHVWLVGILCRWSFNALVIGFISSGVKLKSPMMIDSVFPIKSCFLLSKFMVSLSSQIFYGFVFFDRCTAVIDIERPLPFLMWKFLTLSVHRLVG